VPVRCAARCVLQCSAVCRSDAAPCVAWQLLHAVNASLLHPVALQEMAPVPTTAGCSG
jgi:hypothetical protein